MGCVTRSQTSEDYYTCAWSVELGTAIPRLAVAGQRGVIQIIDCYKHAFVRVSEAISDFLVVS